jgi:oxygen-independent coproporphyrinogen-3 oxidase
VKHPSAYTARLAEGVSPAYAREVLTEEERRFERVLLGTRLVDGHPLDDLHEDGRVSARALVGRGLLDGSALAAGRVVLTLQGRLLADAVVRDLLD